MSTYEFDELSIALGYALSAPSSSSAKQNNNNKAPKEDKKKDTKKPETKKADDFDDLFGEEPAAEDKKAAVADDDMNLFDDEDGETAEERSATIARKARMEAARKLKEDKDLAEGKKKKVKDVERSLVVLEVKPWEADTDLEAVWKMIIAYQQEGLTWGQNFKLEPVAYGIKKLVLTCTIVDSLVLLDDITEKIESLEDFVQSVEIASMNKI